MLALFKLIPIKDWLYAALLTTIILSFSVYTHHEREIGKQEIERADAKVANTVIIHNTEVEARAKTLADAAVAIYKFESSLPPAVDAPHLWVRSRSASGGPLRPYAGNRSRAADETNLSDPRTPTDDSTVEHSADIGPSLDKLLQDADAELTAVQEYIRACQSGGVCKR